MQLIPEITFNGLQSSPPMETKILERVERLDRLHSRIMSCRVVVECSHRHHHKGKLFRVLIDLTVPGSELAVSRDPEKNHAHEDPYVAIRDAFDAMERRLESFAHRRRGEVKAHEAPQVGVVSEVTPEFGRIDTLDGRSLYFHRNSVSEGGFEGLDVGSRVQYLETEDDEGPKASTVIPLGAGEAAA
jgi:ribosome-associated translation inhibitor RaiA/cold shock CspA family protein